MATMTRSWLLKHNKPVDFNLAELKKLRGYFEQLDSDNSGAIGIEELEQPLISLNLCRSREEVQKVMNEIDKDHSG
jgi:Ca2+-binding EF-hand superfamily protein